MVLDSSAIVAIYLREPGYEQLLEKINAAPLTVIGVPTVLEAGMVLTARAHRDARPILRSFLRHAQTEIVPFNEEHLDAALTAFVRFGRGRHRAGLNFGDCMSYAIASVAEMPLLFTGNDFARTDIQPA